MYNSTIKIANCAKIKRISSQEGIQQGKMCTTNLQPFRPISISDQFIFSTKSYFRPIPISDQFLSDQFLFPTNSYFRPIPISDHADCEVGTFSRKHGKCAAACGNFKITSFAAPQIRSQKNCISSLSLDADYDTWHTLEKEERPRGVQSLRRQRPCENSALVKIQTRTFTMRFCDS